MFRYLIVFAILGGLLYWAVSADSKGKGPQKGYVWDTYIVPNKAKIDERMEAALLTMMCVRTPAFPYETGGPRPEPCDACDTLVAAGLLERASSTDAQMNTTARYTLTAAGQARYVASIVPRPSNAPYGWQGQPAVCLGRLQARDLRFALPDTLIGPWVRFKFTPWVLEPHELLYSPQARELKLPQLDRKGDPKLPPMEGCVMFHGKELTDLTLVAPGYACQ